MTDHMACTDCGVIVPLSWRNPCKCPGELVLLRSTADKLAFRLRFTGRPDEAVTVEDRHAVMQEGHGPC